MTLNKVMKFVYDAFLCSVFVAPREPGLTHDELLEVASRVGLHAGEIGDAVAKIEVQYLGRSPSRLLPRSAIMGMWGLFGIPQDPDYRNLAAFDFVDAELKASVRMLGANNAQLERDLIVERAVVQNIPRHDVEAAITLWVLSDHLVEKGGLLRFRPGRERNPAPGQQQAQAPRIPNRQRNEQRDQILGLVKDVIARRTDGRPRHAEPLDSFPDVLAPLGYGHFRLWWTQTAAELRRADSQSAPLSVSVLAAALVEGALTFVVRHARSLGLGVFGSKTFEQEPRSWQIQDLVGSAAAGRDAAILDEPTRQRANRLIQTRQRIHAGRMLVEFPGGVPDLKPEDARDAKATADQVVRRVLEWLEKHPPASQG